MKLAIISDGHLFQSFVENYDSLHDFRTVLLKIKEDRPDVLLMAGDMFDCKKTTSAFLRHYEGEALMMKVRDTLEEFEIPTYAIRGNHEKEEVLNGLNQTVKNFHYVKNDWVRLGDVSIRFMDTHVEGELYDPDAVSQILKQLGSSVKGKEKKILLSHETFEPFPECLPKDIIERTRKFFDFIINGHMHVWGSSAYGLKNVITLPSLLPSRLRLGTYWTEQYVWEVGEDKPTFAKREAPFGYAMMDTGSMRVDFQPFRPSREIVEVSIDVTNLSLKDVFDRFRKILKEINERKDKDALIVLPEMHGFAYFVTPFVNEVFKEYPDLDIEELRNNTEPRMTTAGGEIVTMPSLDPNQLFEEVSKELQKLTEELSEEVKTKISTSVLAKILNQIRENGLLEKLPPRTITRLEIMFSEILPILNDIEKPETFEDDMKSIIRRVKE